MTKSMIKKVEKKLKKVLTWRKACVIIEYVVAEKDNEKSYQKKLKKLKKLLDFEMIIWYITYALESAEKWSLKTEQNVNFKLGNKTELKWLK